MGDSVLPSTLLRCEGGGEHGAPLARGETEMIESGMRVKDQNFARRGWVNQVIGGWAWVAWDYGATSAIMVADLVRI
jgi:hypothetical protein